MSTYRVCKIAVEHAESIQNIKFDNKEDAEHYAKNHSNSDDDHRYDIQINNQGEFSTIKSYLNGKSF